MRGNGTLVPEDIPLDCDGQLRAGAGRIRVLPGARVQADTVLVELSNPDVEQAAFDAEWALKAAEASTANLRDATGLAEVDPGIGAAPRWKRTTVPPS